MRAVDPEAAASSSIAPNDLTTATKERDAEKDAIQTLTRTHSAVAINVAAWPDGAAACPSTGAVRDPSEEAHLFREREREFIRSLA